MSKEKTFRNCQHRQHFNQRLISYSESKRHGGCPQKQIQHSLGRDGPLLQTAVALTWHRCPQRDKHDGSDRVLQANGAAKVGRQVADESCQDADHEDGDNEASPAIPVVCRGHEGKKDLPEDGQKVHHVVKAGGQLLLPTFIVVIVFPWRKPPAPG